MTSCGVFTSMRGPGFVLLLLTACGVSGCNPAAGEARALDDACREGAAAACSELGYKVQTGEHVLRDWRRAVQLYDSACVGGVAEACVRLARMHVDEASERRGVPHDSMLAADLLETACDRGAMNGCVDLADMYAAPDSVVPEVAPMGPLQDLGHAARLYERSCEGGEMPGCTRLGLSYRDGNGVPRDEARAVTLFEQACDGGAALGCAHLGLAYETGAGVQGDVERAAALYEEACDTDVVGCFRLAELMSGIGSPEDRDRIVELFEAACYARAPLDEGSPAMAQSCVRAGEVLATGGMGARDLERAGRYFRRACNLGLEEACGRS